MSRIKKLLIAILILILSIILGTFLATKIWLSGKLSKINYEDVNQEEISKNKDLYNELEGLGANMSEEEFNSIKTIVLYGTDSRDLEDGYNNARSDSIIIASINPNNKSIALVSIPRDTYVSIDGHGKTKINHAFAYGKEQLSMKTINQNFGLSLSEYITIDFSGLVSVIDKAGGVDIEITEAEMEFINKSIDYTAKYSGGDATKLTTYGNVHLNGTQALTHCRNRYVGNDFKRAERQRIVLEALFNKITDKSLTEINSLLDEFLPCIKTNINVSDYTKFIPSVLASKEEYRKNFISEQVPALSYSGDQYISGVYYFVGDLSKAKADMIKYLYGQ